MFKVGDKVKVVRNDSMGRILIGEIGLVLEVNTFGVRLSNPENPQGHGCWYDESEIELMPAESAKPDLGLRFNAGKLRWRNIPMFLLKPLMEVGHQGEKKYATFNFLKGMKANDSLDCLKRHLEKLENPEESDYDEGETGCHHAAMVAWNALVLCYMLVNRPDLDDRYKTMIKKEKADASSNSK